MKINGFFDPNERETRNLSLENLTTKMNHQVIQWQGTDIFISKAASY